MAESTQRGPWDEYRTPAPQQEAVARGPWDEYRTPALKQEAVARGPWEEYARVEAAPKASEPKPEDQSFLRGVADVPLKVGAGVVSGVRLISDAFGAGSDTSKTLRGAEDWIADLYSAQSKQDSKEISRIMKEAEDKGVLDQVKAGVKALSVAPVDTLSHALGTSAPAIAAALLATVFGVETAAAVAIGTGVKALTGAAMGAGTVKGSIYDAVKDELGKTNMPKDEVEKRAILAQEYKGKNLDQILLGTGIGAVAGTTGLEPAAARELSKRIMSSAGAKTAAEKAAKEAADIAAKRGVIKHGAITGGKEFAGEAIEGGQEQLAQNIALQREGFDVPTMRGVVSQATLEGLSGAGLGSVTGGVEASGAKAVIAKEEQTKTDLARLDELNLKGKGTPDKIVTDPETGKKVIVKGAFGESFTPEEQQEYQTLNAIYNPKTETKTETEAGTEATTEPKSKKLIDLTARFEAQGMAREEAENLAKEELAKEEPVKEELGETDVTDQLKAGTDQSGVSVLNEPSGTVGGVTTTQPGELAGASATTEVSTDGTTTQQDTLITPPVAPAASTTAKPAANVTAPTTQEMLKFRWRQNLGGKLATYQQ